MTVVNHGAQSVLIAYAIYPRWYFVLAALILGVIPDIGRLFQKNINDWDKFYLFAHKITARNLIIPFWNLHIAEDYFIHEKTGGWKPWSIYIEIIIWVIMFLIIIGGMN